MDLDGCLSFLPIFWWLQTEAPCFSANSGLLGVHILKISLGLDFGTFDPNICSVLDSPKLSSRQGQRGITQPTSLPGMLCVALILYTSWGKIAIQLGNLSVRCSYLARFVQR